MHKKIQKAQREGFTLIELLLVIGIIGILSSIVIVAIDPQRMLIAAIDAKRAASIREIRSAINQYNIDSGGLPGGIPIGSGNSTPICRGALSESRNNCVSLISLIPEYMAEFPLDPAETQIEFIGFEVYKEGQFITVDAPYMGQGQNSAFTDISFGYMNLWLDAADVNSIVEAGGAVSEWRDKTDDNRHATQGTGGAQPTTNSRTQNGVNVIDFDGNDQMSTAINITAGQPYTVFIVGKFDSIAADMNLFDTTTVADRTALRYDQAAGDMEFNAGTAQDFMSTNTDAHIYTIIANGTNTSMWIDGTGKVTANSGTNQFGILKLGAAEDDTADLDGFIAEMIVIPNEVDDRFREDTEAYLAEKWGL